MNHPSPAAAAAAMANLTPLERSNVLTRMKSVAGRFHSAVLATGFAPFQLFSEVLHDYVRLCERAHEAGSDFVQGPLPLERSDAERLADALIAIYGPKLQEDADVRQGLVFRLSGMNPQLASALFGELDRYTDEELEELAKTSPPDSEPCRPSLRKAPR